MGDRRGNSDGLKIVPDYPVDERAARLVRAVETFVGAFGAELADAQSALSPVEFARFIGTLGIGRAKAERFMALARLQVQPSELRPSAWWLLFRATEPIPMLPGEADPIIDYAVAKAEPPEYRRRTDLLSADGLVLLLVALHGPDALDLKVAQRLSTWLESGDHVDAAEVLASWRQAAVIDIEPPAPSTLGG
jgi:hypothetical protein